MFALDPTLPILNTIKCPNSDCVVNKKDEYFKNKLVLSNVFFNLNNKITNHIQSVFAKKPVYHLQKMKKFYTVNLKLIK